MWMMTPRGFYSAVQKRDDRPDLITVRARSKDDLENLRDLLPDAEWYPDQPRWSDYPVRLRCTAAEWAHACARMALEVDYGNFKDEVKRVQGKKRADIYMGLWSRLLSIEGTQSWQDRYYGGWDDGRDLDNDGDLLGLSGRDLDDAIDRLPGAKVDDAFAKKESVTKAKAKAKAKAKVQPKLRRKDTRKKGQRR